jgi:hypothetical protein
VLKVLKEDLDLMDAKALRAFKVLRALKVLQVRQACRVQ